MGATQVLLFDIVTEKLELAKRLGFESIFNSAVEDAVEVVNVQKNGIRSRYGGTVLAQGLVKNTLVKHVKHGLTRLSGINAKGLFSIYSLDGKRITTGAKRQDFKVLTRLNFNYRSGLSSPT